MVESPKSGTQQVHMVSARLLLRCADGLQLLWRRYDLATEFAEALDHAQDQPKNTKILLRISEVGVTPE